MMHGARETDVKINQLKKGQINNLREEDMKYHIVYTRKNTKVQSSRSYDLRY